jgi:hypothetical protein
MANHRAITLAVAVFLLASLQAPNIKAADADGVMMHDGKMMMMKDSKPTSPMENAMTMTNGATVTPDGTVKMKDGGETHMKDGQMMMMDGHMIEGEHNSMMGGSTGGMNH